ncbi:hypothetical protein RFI_22088, partial [Reticulomyxa filosa]
MSVVLKYTLHELLEKATDEEILKAFLLTEDTKLEKVSPKRVKFVSNLYRSLLVDHVEKFLDQTRGKSRYVLLSEFSEGTGITLDEFVMSSKENKKFFESLPEVVWSRVINYIDTNERISKLTCLCRDMYNLVYSPVTWNTFTFEAKKIPIEYWKNTFLFYVGTGLKQVTLQFESFDEKDIFLRYHNVRDVKMPRSGADEITLHISYLAKYAKGLKVVCSLNRLDLLYFILL